MWVPFCVLSQDMSHINSFLGGQNGWFWVGAKKFMLNKSMCFLHPPLIWLMKKKSKIEYKPHKQESRRSGPEIPKKVFPGLSAQSVKKASKRSPNTDFDTFFTLFRVLSGLFWYFFDTLAGSLVALCPEPQNSQSDYFFAADCFFPFWSDEICLVELGQWLSD